LLGCFGVHRRNQGMAAMNQPRARKTVKLSESVSRQLCLYAIGATAAGVGVLAFAQSAEAEIVYMPAHRVIGPNKMYRLDLNHDGITDFTLNNYGGWRVAHSLTRTL
jgi:hypothetical protein